GTTFSCHRFSAKHTPRRRDWPAFRKASGRLVVPLMPVVRPERPARFAAGLPLMTQMVPGEISVRKDSRDYYLAVGEGLIEVVGDHVAVLTDMAIASDKIDEAKVEEARQRAEARLHDKLSDEEVASVNASLARSLAQLQVKRRQ